MRDPKATLLYRWFNEVWNDLNKEAIDKLMQDDGFAHGLVGDEQPMGKSGFLGFYEWFTGKFKDIHIEVEDVVSENDMECARTKVVAVDRKSNKKVKFFGTCMAKIKDGKIAGAWNHYDFLGMYEQLGEVVREE